MVAARPLFRDDPGRVPGLLPISPVPCAHPATSPNPIPKPIIVPITRPIRGKAVPQGRAVRKTVHPATPLEAGDTGGAVLRWQVSGPSITLAHMPTRKGEGPG